MGARDTIELIRIRVTRTPPVVTLVLTLTLAFTYLPFYASGRVEEATLSWGCSYLSLLSGEPWRLITSSFIHLSVAHLAVNALGLLVVGAEVERLIGGGGLASLALSSSVIGGLAALWWRDFSMTCGASLMVYGLFGGALSFYFSLARVEREEWRWRAILSSLWLTYGLVTGYQSPGVDYVGHTAGLAAGLLLGFILRASSGGVARRATFRVFFARVLIVALAAAAWGAFSVARPITSGVGGYVAWLEPHERVWSERLKARQALSLSEWRELWTGDLHLELTAARTRLAEVRERAGFMALAAAEPSGVAGRERGALRYTQVADRYLSLLIAGGEASVSPPAPLLAAPLTQLLSRLRSAEGALSFALSDQYQELLYGQSALSFAGSGDELLRISEQHLSGQRPLSAPLAPVLLTERLLAAPRVSFSRAESAAHPAERTLRRLNLRLLGCVERYQARQAAEGRAPEEPNAERAWCAERGPLERLYTTLVALGVAEALGSPREAAWLAGVALMLLDELSPLEDLEQRAREPVAASLALTEWASPGELARDATSLQALRERWEPLAARALWRATAALTPLDERERWSLLATLSLRSLSPVSGDGAEALAGDLRAALNTSARWLSLSGSPALYVCGVTGGPRGLWAGVYLDERGEAWLVTLPLSARVNSSSALSYWVSESAALLLRSEWGAMGGELGDEGRAYRGADGAPLQGVWLEARLLQDERSLLLLSQESQAGEPQAGEPRPKKLRAHELKIWRLGPPEGLSRSTTSAGAPRAPLNPCAAGD